MASVTVSGSAVKQVKCEKCPCEYVYEMAAQNTVRADSSGYVVAGGLIGGVIGGAIAGAISGAAGGSAAQDKLRSQAQENVNRKLAKGCEPVPCPACGWYQAQMVRESRRRYRKPMLGLGATLMVLGSALLMVLLAMTSSPTSTVSPIAFVVAAAIILCGLGVLAWRWSMQQAYDINQGYPSARPPYAGSPQGFDIKKLAQAVAASPIQASGAAPAFPPEPAAPVL